MANLGIDFNEVSNELFEAAKFCNLACGLFPRSGIRERLRHSLSLHFVGQSRVRTMYRLAGLVTAAVRLAATATGIGDGPAAQIAQTGELSDEFGAMRLEIL
ncbi:MAG: hypothetical protein JOY93_05890 [Acidobacteriales bacterium]|nr:hypothetical protein [Terriglobales bacterium]